MVKLRSQSCVIFPTYVVFHIYHFSLGKEEQSKINLEGEGKKVSFTKVIVLETAGKTVPEAPLF